MMKRLTALLLALFFLLPAGCTAPAAEGDAGEDPAPQTPPVTQPAGDGTPEEPEPEPLPEQPEQPQIPEWVWQHDDPENCGLSASALQSLHSELDGTAVQACVIVRGGVIADEYYKDGYDAGTSFLLHSCSKSVTSALVGIAIDQGAARLMGINVDRVISLVFFIGAGLGGVAGVMVGTYYGQIDFTMGWSYGLKAFTAAILGGIGNIPGAMIGGLLLGVIEALGASYLAMAWKDAIAFLVLILILIIRPTGLLGERVADKL